MLDGGPDPPFEGTILKRECHLHGKWLAEIAAERARTTVLLQRNPSFGETSDQVHFSCDVHILCLTVSGYELSEHPHT